MQIAQQVLVLLHLIGFAALLGGILVQVRDPEPEISGAVLAGAWIETVTGAALFVLAELGPGPVPTGWLVVKSVLTVIVLVLAAANRRYAAIPRGLWALLGVLTLIGTGISVFGQ